jgi:hypothetical protein
MTPQTKEVLARMAEVLEQLNTSLQQELSDLQRSGAPAPAVTQLQAGVKAIQDCGQMLLIWSDYIARGDFGRPHDHESHDSIESLESRPDPFPR